MVVQYSTAVRDAVANVVESTIGPGPTLEIRTGSQPANCAAADSGTLLATITLPSDWLSNPSAGVKTLLGTWQANAGAAGTAGHFRLKQGGTCHMQGSITATGGGGDLTLQNTSIASGQTITITANTLTATGA